MIKIVAKCTLKEGTKEKFIQMTQELINGSKQEEGCIAYDLYADLSDPNVVCYLEEWKDQAAIDLHNQTPHYKKWVPILNELKVRPTEVSLYQKL